MFQLEGVTSHDFHTVIADLSSTISDCDGWITNHKFYSNIMAMIAFEIPGYKVCDLVDKLNQIKIFTNNIEMPPTSALEEIKGQINITFIHSKLDIHRTVPEFDV